MKKDRWLNLTEYVLLLGSGAGTLASVVTQQALLAAAPLSLLAALGLINRQQLRAKLTQSQSLVLAINNGLDKRLQDVQSQLENLPTHKQLTAVRQSVIAQNKQDILSLSQVIEHTRPQPKSQFPRRTHREERGSCCRPRRRCRIPVHFHRRRRDGRSY